MGNTTQFLQRAISGSGHATSCVVAAIKVSPGKGMEENRQSGKCELLAKTEWVRTAQRKDIKIKGGRYLRLLFSCKKLLK